MIWRAACVLYTWWLSALAINPCRHMVQLPGKSNEELHATSHTIMNSRSRWQFEFSAASPYLRGKYIEKENFLTPPLSSCRPAAGRKNSSRALFSDGNFIEAYNKGERQKPNQADTEANEKTSQDLLYWGSCARRKTRPSCTQARAAPVETQPQNTRFIRPPLPTRPWFRRPIHLFILLMFDSDSVHYLPSPPHPLPLLISSPHSAWGAHTTWRLNHLVIVEWG